MSFWSHPLHSIGKIFSFGHEERKAGNEMQKRYQNIINEEAPEWKEALARYGPIENDLGWMLKNFGGTPPGVLGNFAGRVEDDPGYKFRLNQGLDALANQQARSGYLRSTDANNDVMKYAQGLASQEYNNMFNRQSQEYQNWFNRHSNILNALSGLKGVYNNIDRYYQGEKNNANLGGQYAFNRGRIGGTPEGLFGTLAGAALGAYLGGGKGAVVKSTLGNALGGGSGGGGSVGGQVNNQGYNVGMGSTTSVPGGYQVNIPYI